MLKLRRLEIEKFRAVRPGTVLVFNDGINVLLGKNGTGKTTLLKLVAAAASGNFFGFRDEEFALKWEMSFGGYELRCSAVHRQSSPLPTLDESSLGEAPFSAGPAWTSGFELEMFKDGERRCLLSWLDGKVALDSAPGRREYTGRASFLEDSDVSFISALVLEARLFAPRPLSRTRNLGQLTRVARYDESLVWFYRQVIRAASLRVLRVHEMGVSSAFYRWLGMPPWFFSGLSSTQLSDPPPEALELRNDQEEVLQRACDALGFSRCSMRLEFERSEPGSREFRNVRETIDYKGVRFFFTRRDGSRITHEHLSFGQQRLFAFLYFAEMHDDSIIVADELTNGLHHSMIELCLETIGERQAFLATQNPLLLDHIGFTSAEQVRGTFVLCDLDVEEGGREVMRWYNMSEAQAREFFGDYEVGIQHVNDILRTRGLW